ncbi:hypothetical protein ACFCY8_10310 [Streptomyces noursei]|uniref:hypothetical protein n=1 Tax=Streptomyces noursei TaxID=1971 RepID=UPI0035D57431
MTTQSAVEDQQHAAYPPGTVVFDTVAGVVGRVAPSEAYPAEPLYPGVQLVEPRDGSGSAWQAEPGALRSATPEEAAVAP